MGKQGPCYHCGATSTPLWRNGPPEKPVLCNACGSRWRTKGSLVNYTPLHLRTDDIDINNHHRPPKRKPYQEINNKNNKKSFLDEEVVSNRSSSGSVVSNSESCNVWDSPSTFPSKKRTCVGVVGRPKAVSSVEKLTKDLFSILQEQQQQQSSCCLSSEGDLLFENDSSMVIGYGSVLMSDPSVCEEESEASSLLVENSKSSRTKSQVFDEFVGKFTKEELMKLVPQADYSVDLPNRLRSMFKENFSLFHQLVANGVFNTSSESKLEDFKILIKLVLSDPNKSHSLEDYYMLKEEHRKGVKEVIKIRSNHVETEEVLENSVTSFNSKSYGGSVVFGYEDNDISDQDLLLDVPSNGSFPQAEFLHMI